LTRIEVKRDSVYHDDVVSRYASILLAGFAIALPPVTRPQVRPDFSGAWTFVPPEAAEALKATFLRTWTGDPVTITQTSVTITVEYVSGSRAHAPVTLVYNLDGSERRNVDRNSVSGFPAERPTRAVWQGTRLALTTTAPRTTNGESDPVVTTEVLSLESPTTMSVAITITSKTLTERALATYRRTGTADTRRVDSN
jgi:hypothetical protein